MTAIRVVLVCLGMVLGVCGRVVDAQNQPRRYDVVLKGGTVHRGDGSEPFVANVAIDGGKIAAISDEPLTGQLVLDCTGLIVSPGFIDLHSHSDRSILDRLTRANVNYLLQGCTTVVTGNCGFGPVDVEQYLRQVDEQGAGTHVAHLLPGGALRDEVMGKANRKPTEEELARMRELADKAMRDGAYGMSTGLIYIPGIFADTAEITEVAKVIAKHSGIYASHIRGEGGGQLESVQEAIRIGKDSGAAVHISHLKVRGEPYWGRLRLAVDLIEKSRAAGQTVTADQYPYTASSTSLEATLLPGWCREGGRPALEMRLNDPETFQRIRNEVAEVLKTASRIQLASCRYKPEWVGKSIQELGAEKGVEVVDVVLEIEKNGGAAVVNFAIGEEDVRYAMPYPWVATASDSSAKIPTGDKPHPRGFGTFPRKIGYYAIAEKVLPLADAIRSCTGLPATILGLTDRGWLREGLAADVVVFDPKTIRDRATFDQPDLPATGMRHVFVDGVLAVYDGQATGALAGKALRKAGSEAASGKRGSSDKKGEGRTPGKEGGTAVPPV